MLTRETIVTSIGQLAVTPRVLRHLVTFLKSPDEDMTPAIDALRAEPVLTTAIVAACNTALHYRGGKVGDLESAIHRLGYRETYRVALLITFRQGLGTNSLPDSQAADYLWLRAATAACAMEELAENEDDRATHYTIGLLHLMGCFVLAKHDVQALPPPDSGWRELAQAQVDQCRIAYPEAGAVALESWGFPPRVTQPIAWQLNPQGAGEWAESARHLAQAAGVASFIEASRPGSPNFDPAQAAAAEVDELTRVAEKRSLELIHAFYPRRLRRPLWVQDV